MLNFKNLSKWCLKCIYYLYKEKLKMRNERFKFFVLLGFNCIR